MKKFFLFFVLLLFMVAPSFSQDIAPPADGSQTTYDVRISFFLGFVSMEADYWYTVTPGSQMWTGHIEVPTAFYLDEVPGGYLIEAELSDIQNPSYSSAIYISYREHLEGDVPGWIWGNWCATYDESLYCNFQLPN